MHLENSRYLSNPFARLLDCITIDTYVAESIADFLKHASEISWPHKPLLMLESFFGAVEIYVPHVAFQGIHDGIVRLEDHTAGIDVLLNSVRGVSYKQGWYLETLAEGTALSPVILGYSLRNNTLWIRDYFEPVDNHARALPAPKEASLELPAIFVPT